VYFYFAYEPLSHFRNNDAGIVLGTWRKRRGQSLKWKMSSIRMQWRDEVEKKMPRRSRGNVSPSSQDGPG